MANLNKPHIALPFRFVNGRPAINEQDSLDEISNCVEAILRCRQGFRIEKPEFGNPDQTFSVSPDLLEVSDTISLWEPRAEDSLSQEYIEQLAYHIRTEISRRESPGA